MSDHERDTEVVKWYTRARRFPQLIGRTPDGARIWGGPYTYTQFFGGVAVLVVGAKTVGVWGQFGLIGNALLLLAVAYTVTVVLGRLPIGSRNPLAVAAGGLRVLSCPPAGRLAGHPVRVRRSHRAHTRVVINPPEPTPAVPVAEPIPDTDPVAHPASPARSDLPPPSHPAPQTTAAAAPALTGVQRLLASSGPPQRGS